VTKRKTHTRYQTDTPQEWVAGEQKDMGKMAKAEIDALQLKWGCARETALYIRVLQARIRHLQDTCEVVDSAKTPTSDR
jgi:hypothetical protein